MTSIDPRFAQMSSASLVRGTKNQYEYKGVRATAVDSKESCGTIGSTKDDLIVWRAYRPLNTLWDHWPIFLSGAVGAVSILGMMLHKTFLVRCACGVTLTASFVGLFVLAWRGTKIWVRLDPIDPEVRVNSSQSINAGRPV
jgi:hypothetical protein